MCLLLFAYKKHPKYPFVLMANRDEFYSRPAKAMSWWPDAPDVLAGKDTMGGGTWMGVSRSGRFAALTNYREPHRKFPDAPSRGDLVRNFLEQNISSEKYLENLNSTSQKYAGFNLIVFDKKNLCHLSNRENKINILKTGIYGLSNALLDTPWPKVELGKNALTKAISAESVDPKDLFRAMQNPQIFADEQLPDTGVSIEWERRLSASFIQSPDYGTRCSTVFMQNEDGNFYIEERTYDKMNEGAVSFGKA